MHNLEIEQSLLGTLVHNPTLIDEHRLTDEIFFNKKSKKVYTAVRDLSINGETVDVLSVAHKIPDDCRMFLTDCNSRYFSPTTATNHIDILTKLSFRRRLLNVSQQIQTIAKADEIDESALDKAQSMLMAEHSAKRSQTIFEAVGETLEIAEAIQSGERSGLETGLKALDEGIGGLHNSDLVVVAARPGKGKSALAIQVGAHVSRIGHTAIFTLEMSAQQLAQRILCAAAKVSGHKLRTGTVSPQEWERLVDAEQHFAPLDMTIHDEPIQNILDIRSACRRADNLKLIIVDYLQLMTSIDNYQGSRNQQVSEISRSLKALAKEFDVPVLALSQLSRKNEMREDKRPVLSDLRETGAIEQDADIVCFLHQEKEEEKVFTGVKKTELIVAKHRHGPVGTHRMVFDDTLAMFRDVGR